MCLLQQNENRGGFSNMNNMKNVFFVILFILLILLFTSCKEEDFESQYVEIVSLTRIPEHWSVGIVDQSTYRPGSPSVSAVLIHEQYVVVLDKGGTIIEIQVASEKFVTLSVGDLVVYNQNKGIIDE